jgi:hypothetical protein
MLRKMIILALTLGAVGIAVLWPVSYCGGLSLVLVEAPGEVFWLGQELWLLVIAHHGRLWVSCGSEIDLDSYIRPSFRFGCAGLGIDRTVGVLNAWVIYHIVIPLWMLLVLWAAYPAIAFARRLLDHRRRRKRNQCVHCGYNLTGNVSGVCPECGRSTSC